MQPAGVLGPGCSPHKLGVRWRADGGFFERDVMERPLSPDGAYYLAVFKTYWRRYDAAAARARAAGAPLDGDTAHEDALAQGRAWRADARIPDWPVYGTDAAG